MMSYKDTGIIERTVSKITREELIEWRIPDFSILVATSPCLESPIFIVNDVSWFLTLYLRMGSNLDFLRVYIETKEIREYTLEYTFSLKKSDGSMEHMVNGILEGNRTCSDSQNLIKRSEILQRNSELTPQDVATLICKLKYEIIHPTQLTTLDKTKTHKLISLDALSENFKELFVNQESCDTVLNVKNKEYKAHQTVLIAWSSVFAAIFKHDTLEGQTGIITISDCDSDSFEVFLKFLYCGKLEEISYHSALNLYYTSEKYDVQELKALCIEYLMQNLTVEGICEVAVLADKYDEAALFSAVQAFFNENVGKIFATTEWQCFMKTESHLATKLVLEMSKVKLEG